LFGGQNDQGRSFKLPFRGRLTGKKAKERQGEEKKPRTIKHAVRLVTNLQRGGGREKPASRASCHARRPE